MRYGLPVVACLLISLHCLLIADLSPLFADLSPQGKVAGM
jgi:hypothetical protein